MSPRGYPFSLRVGAEFQCFFRLDASFRTSLCNWGHAHASCLTRTQLSRVVLIVVEGQESMVHGNAFHARNKRNAVSDPNAICRNGSRDEGSRGSGVACLSKLDKRRRGVPAATHKKQIRLTGTSHSLPFLGTPTWRCAFRVLTWLMAVAEINGPETVHFPQG